MPAYLLQEDNTSKVLLEDGTGAVLLEGSAAGAPTNSVAPAVTGTPQVGVTLSCSNGTWTDDGSPTFTYQWQVSADGSTGWADIALATASSYTAGSGDQTKYLRCNVTDTDSGGATTAASNVVGPVAAGAAPSFNPAVLGSSFL